MSVASFSISWFHLSWVFLTVSLITSFRLLISIFCNAPSLSNPSTSYLRPSIWVSLVAISIFFKALIFCCWIELLAKESPSLSVRSSTLLPLTWLWVNLSSISFFAALSFYSFSLVFIRFSWAAFRSFYSLSLASLISWSCCLWSLHYLESCPFWACSYSTRSSKRRMAVSNIL